MMPCLFWLRWLPWLIELPWDAKLAAQPPYHIYYLSSSGLFNDVVSSSGYTALLI